MNLKSVRQSPEAMHIMLLIFRRSATIMLFGAVLSYLFSAPAYPQSSQCEIFAALTEIDQGAAQLTRENTLEMEQLAEEIRARSTGLGARGASVLLAAQMLQQPDWLDDFLRSRRKTAELFQAQRWKALSLHLRAPDYRGFGEELALLRRVAPCEAASPDGPMAELGPLDTENTGANMPLVSPTGQLKPAPDHPSVMEILEDAAIEYAPYLIFATSFAAIWAGMKFDEFQTQSRQRYFCDVEVLFTLDGDEHLGTLTNISRRGAGISAEGNLDSGRKILLKIGAWEKRAIVARSGEGFIGVRFPRRLRGIPKEINTTGKKKWERRRDYSQ